jgi:hypothetical protein
MPNVGGCLSTFGEENNLYLSSHGNKQMTPSGKRL